jgi:fluoroquinolone resistance protein
MSTPLSPHKSYEDRRFSAQRAADLRGAQFESCTFVDIDFSQATLQGVNFQDCLFQRCDLSRAILTGAQFQEAQFESCRLMGINWSAAVGLLLAFRMQDCNASFSIFHGVDLRACGFSDSNLAQSEFQKANLSGLRFEGCDLSGANLHGAKMHGSDFSSARGVFFDPSRCALKDTRLDLNSALGVLAAQGIVVS